MDAVGIEKTAEWCYKTAQTYLEDKYGDRCWVEKVEVYEHEANSAIYSEPRPMSMSCNTAPPSTSSKSTPLVISQSNEQPFNFDLHIACEPSSTTEESKGLHNH